MALYMNGQEISQSSGVPITVEGLTEINEGTPSNISGLVKGDGSTLQAAIAGTDYIAPPTIATALPSSGTELTANTIYRVSVDVGTYSFIAPLSGWVHGKFYTGSSVSVSFNGEFLGAEPTIEASKEYEFDVYNRVWAVAEIVAPEPPVSPK